MHLVFATSLIPDERQTTGYDIANAVIVDALRRAGVRITLLGFAWPGQQGADKPDRVVLGELDLRTEAAPTLQKLQWLAKAVYLELTFSSVKMRGVSIKTLEEQLAKIEPFDGFIINAVQFAGAFESLFRSKPAMLIAHNVEFRSAEENAAAARSLLLRLLYKREARLLKSIEARLCRNACYIFTLTEEDRSTLGFEQDDRSSTLALVKNREYFAPSSPRVVTCDAALIGNWTWQPNRIGLDWFLAHVVPCLPRHMRIRIAGHIPSGIRSDHPGVQFVSHVSDAVAFLRTAAVVPLVSRAGTGIQLKTIEVFENGLPCVATTRSLRGIQYRPKNCMVTDDPHMFADALHKFAKNAVADVDGQTFYRDQRNILDSQIRRGLEVMKLCIAKSSSDHF